MKGGTKEEETTTGKFVSSGLRNSDWDRKTIQLKDLINFLW